MSATVTFRPGTTFAEGERRASLAAESAHGVGGETHG